MRRNAEMALLFVMLAWLGFYQSSNAEQTVTAEVNNPKDSALELLANRPFELSEFPAGSNPYARETKCGGYFTLYKKWVDQFSGEKIDNVVRQFVKVPDAASGAERSVFVDLPQSFYVPLVEKNRSGPPVATLVYSGGKVIQLTLRISATDFKEAAPCLRAPKSLV